MSLDPIADLLTKLRNASLASNREVTVNLSKMNENIVKILKDQQYIDDFEVVKSEGKSQIDIKLNRKLRTLNLKRISSPGQRTYVSYSELKPVMYGYGIGLISTSQGVMTFRDAKKKKVGGEVLAHIW